MAAPSPEKRITGRPPVSQTNYVIERFGDAGGASLARFYAWGGIRIIGVNDSAINNFNISLQLSYCLTITVPWSGSPGRIRGDLTGGCWIRGGYETWNWDDTPAADSTIYWQSNDLDLSTHYKTNEDVDLERFSVTVYPGSTIRLWCETGSYSGGGYNSSTLTPIVIKFPNAPYAYFHWNDPRSSSEPDYHGDSGTATDSTVYSIKRAWEGNSYTFPANPEITQYEFLGWFDHPTGGNQVTNLTAQVLPNHLYAHWALVGHNVTYNGNGETGGSMAVGVKPIGEDYTVEDCGFTKNDYTFQNWNTQANGQGTTYAVGATYTVDADLTLYAIWKRNHHLPRQDTLPIVKRCKLDSQDNVVIADDGTMITVTSTFIYDKLWAQAVMLRVYYMDNLSQWVKVSTDNDSIFTITGSPSDQELTHTMTLEPLQDSEHPFATDSSYRIKIEFYDRVTANSQWVLGSSVETFLSSAFFYLDINEGHKVIAIGAGAGETAATWDNDGEEEIDQSGTVGTVDIHTNTLFSNDVYFHQGSRLILPTQDAQSAGPGTPGQVLVSSGSGSVGPYWRSPIDFKLDTIYSHPGSTWATSKIGGGTYYANGELDTGYSIMDYDFLIIFWKAGNSSTLSNARGNLIVKVSDIYQYHSDYDEQTGQSAEIESATNCFEIIYTVPASAPSWYIDIAFGFFNDHHIYATRRFYNNLPYWNIEKIYGVKLVAWGLGSPSSDYPLYTGTRNITPSASSSQEFETENTTVTSDLTVAQIPYTEVGNEAGGRTATIAS